MARETWFNSRRESQKAYNLHRDGLPYQRDQRQYFKPQGRPPITHIRLDERAAVLPDDFERAWTRLMSDVPQRHGHPTTTLYRWAVYQSPPLTWPEALELFNANRIPSAYRDGKRILIPLDKGIIDERGLLAAVRSVEVLPTSPGRW